MTYCSVAAKQETVYFQLLSCGVTNYLQTHLWTWKHAHRCLEGDWLLFVEGQLLSGFAHGALVFARERQVLAVVGKLVGVFHFDLSALRFELGIHHQLLAFPARGGFDFTRALLV